MDLLQNRMKLFHDNYVVNWHEHVWESEPGVLKRRDCDTLVEASKATGIDLLLCSCPVVPDRYCSPERQRIANDVVVEATKLYPDMIRGMCFVNPGYVEESCKEIERCVKEHGFVGIKMYHQYFMNDPVQFKIIEKCIELDIPILMHAGHLPVHQPVTQPHLSGGEHFADVAKRYPEANFIMAHITGGGDWYWQLKAIKNCPNVVTDLSGSVCDTNSYEETLRYLGADRILWGSDGSVSGCVGKMIAADIPEEDKIKILAGESYKRFLERGRA